MPEEQEPEENSANNNVRLLSTLERISNRFEERLREAKPFAEMISSFNRK